MENSSYSKNVDIKQLYFPSEFIEPTQLYEMLTERLLEYHPSSDLKMIEDAYLLAYNAHKEQKRKSGEPYIIHPLCVAMTLAELRMDKETIDSGLLHDIVEDTILTNEEIKDQFGEAVAIIVDGVTKLTHLSTQMSSIDIKAENLRKFFLFMANDIRVVLVKLADRLHNIRTLQFQPPAKQIEIAKETLEIYAPLALRLGISIIQAEMADLAFMYLNRDAYQDILDQLKSAEGQRLVVINKMIEELSNLNTKVELKVTQKSVLSVYNKTVKQNLKVEDLYDTFAIYVIVDTVKECYSVLGEIHSLYNVIPNRFKDYIALPKQNMYQSLHTTVITKEGTLFEIQIKTRKMYYISQYGITYYWKYNEKEKEKDVIKNKWLQSILEWQREERDSNEFLSFLKLEMGNYADTIHCFTPSGKIKILPEGSTVIDFAYLIHSELGNNLDYAIVNGKRESMNYTLKNGDQIKIIPSGTNAGPNRKWLSMVKTPNAKNKIKQYLKGKDQDKNSNKKTKFLFSKCCNPLPDDKIVGYCSNSRGIMIHKISCENVTDLVKKKSPKLIEVSWEEIRCKHFVAAIIIESSNRVGLGKELFNIFEKLNVAINKLSINTKNEDAEIEISIYVTGKEQLALVKSEIKLLDGIRTIR